MSAAFGVTFMPFLFLSIPAGFLADRYSSKLILVSCDLASFALLLFLGVLALTESSIAIIFGFLFAYSCVAPFHYPAFHTAMRRSVPTKHLGVWIGRATSIEQASTVLTPAFGGLLAISLDPAVFLCLSAAFLALSALLVARSHIGCRGVSSTIEEGTRFWQDIKISVQVLYSRPLLLMGSAGLALANFSSTLLQASITFAVLDTLDLTSFHLGLFLSLTGVGGILGSLVASSIIEKFDVTNTMIVTATFSALILLPMFIGSFVVITICWSLASFVGSISAVAFYTYRQIAVDDFSVGKVISITRLITLSAIPPAAFISGPILSAGGISAIVALMFIARLIAAGSIAYGIRIVDG